MKIIFKYLENDIIISNDNVFAIEVENKNYFHRIVSDFNDIGLGNVSENICCYESNKEVNISGKLYVLIDFFNIEFESKKLLNALYKSIKNNIKDDCVVRIKNYYNKIKNIVEDSLLDYDIALNINEEPELENILKLLKVSISKKESLLENLFLLIDLENNLNINNILIFVNLKQLLSKTELEELYKYSLLNEINVIMIDSQSYGVNLKNEKKLIIDCDVDEFLI